MKLCSEINLQNLISDSPQITSRSNNRSFFAQVLIESRVSLILLLLLQGDTDQAKDFSKKLIEDSNSAVIQVSPTNCMFELLDSLVVDLYFVDFW
jgi:hypothetical protein